MPFIMISLTVKTQQKNLHISIIQIVLFDIKSSYRVNSIILITEHIISVVRHYITRAELIIVIITISV